MRTSSTFSILFWVYAKRIKNNKAPLYARVTVDRKKLNISLKRRIDTRLWNPQKQRVKGTTDKARHINQYLDEIYAKLFQCYQELRAEDRRITPQSIKAKFLGDEAVHYTLKDLIEYHNAKMFHQLHPATARHYRTSQKYILLFLKKEYKMEDMELAELDYMFVLNFENFLRNYKPKHYQKQIGNNTTMKHIQRLRRMVTLAYNIEWLDHDPFRKFRQKLTTSNRGFLTPEELERVEELVIDSVRLRTVRNLFVFSCYTGISFSDVMVLTRENVVKGMDGAYWVITQRQKTGNPVKIPLLSKALNLIKCYVNNKKAIINGTLFPKLSNQKMNAYLKEIAQLAKIKKNLTFHMARHTFATTVTLANGVPIETISKMLGHSKLSTTQIYAKVLERKVSEDMHLLRKKLGENLITDASF